MVIYIFFNVEPVLGDLDGRLRAQSLKPHLHLLSGWRPEIPRNTVLTGLPGGTPQGGARGLLDYVLARGRERTVYTPLHVLVV